MKITLVGAGNLATCLGLALREKGHEILQVWSRTEASAKTLAQKLDCSWTTELAELTNAAELYILSVKDSVLEDIGAALPKDILVVHTAGSMPMDALPQSRRGVFYPMQTFSKQRAVCFDEIPIFIEASNMDDLAILRNLAESVSNEVHELSSSQRRYLHVAAVFACNMTNHCYDLAGQILEEHGIQFKVLLPLIDETARKVHMLSPKAAQTGPAVRWDENVIQRHLDMLDDTKREIYKIISESIHRNTH